MLNPENEKHKSIGYGHETLNQTVFKDKDIGLLLKPMLIVVVVAAETLTAVGELS